MGVVAGQGGQQSTTSKWRDWGKGRNSFREPHFHPRQVEEAGSTKSLNRCFQKTYAIASDRTLDTSWEAQKASYRGQNHSLMSQKINMQNAPRAVLYAREGCHLCDDAELLLLQHGLVPEIVDIDRNDDLKSRFGMSVPVVEIDGRVRFRGRVNRVLLRRILEHYRG